MSESAVLPMWRGRRGLAATIVCGALGTLAAAALWVCAVRVAVRPACESYGRDHGMTYVDYKVYRKKQHASSACILAAPSGVRHDVLLPDAASQGTDFLVGLAFSLDISIPAFTILFAVVRTRVSRRGREAEPAQSRD